MGCIGSYCNNYTTPCKNVGKQCAAWSSSYGDNQYSCSGHQDLRPRNTPTFDDYDVGTIIDDTNINTLRARVVEELNARKAHVWYTQKVNSLDSGKDVAEGDTIDHPQQNVLVDCMNSLNEFINSKSSVGEVNGGASTPYGTKPTDLQLVDTEDYVEAENLKHLERAWPATTEDCICYCDCVGYNAGGRLVCSCYGYCCHY